MARQVQHGTAVPEVENEEVLEFIVGFPCTQFSCHGNLRRGTHLDRAAVRCSVCEHLYYVLASD